jgi:dual specificity phosphatase 12
MLYTKIIDHLYLGSYNDVIKEYYKEENISVIINVAKECKNMDETVEYYSYRYNDRPSENLYTNFDNIVDLIHSYRVMNKNVFIHCYAGKSRSATFVIVYLMKYLMYDLNTAYEYVNNLREIYPNLGFVNQMMRYEMDKISKSTLDYDKIVVKYIYSITGFISKEKIKEIYENEDKDVDKTIDRIFEDYE